MHAIVETTCSCGDPEIHEVARRSTADGKHVCLWSDGMLTWALGYHIRGAASRPRTAAQIEVARRAGWMVMDEVCLYDASDVALLVKAARWAAERGCLRDTMRTRMHIEHVRLRTPAPAWTVLSANREGTPTSRVWVLHRMSSWSGVAVFDEQFRGKRYHVHRVDNSHVTGIRWSADPAYRHTGFSFDTIDEVRVWLDENRE